VLPRTGAPRARGASARRYLLGGFKEVLFHHQKVFRLDQASTLSSPSSRATARNSSASQGLRDEGRDPRLWTVRMRHLVSYNSRTAHRPRISHRHSPHLKVPQESRRRASRGIRQVRKRTPAPTPLHHASTRVSSYNPSLLRRNRNWQVIRSSFPPRTLLLLQAS
jgi:hypothetical protein